MNNVRIKHGSYVWAGQTSGRTDNDLPAVVIGITPAKPGVALVRFLGTTETMSVSMENLHGPVGYCIHCKQMEYHWRECVAVNPTALAMLGKEALVIKIKA